MSFLLEHFQCVCCFLVVTIAASVVALFVVGFVVVAPYMKTTKFSPDAKQCTLERVEMDGSISCDCGSDDETDCFSEYPCVKIFVNYRDADGELRTNAPLYYSAKDYALLKENDCFAWKCGYSCIDNRKAVMRLVKQVESSAPEFLCHPSLLGRESEVLLYVVPHAAVLAGMLIPAAFLIIAGIAVLVIDRCG